MEKIENSSLKNAQAVINLEECDKLILIIMSVVLCMEGIKMKVRVPRRSNSVDNFENHLAMKDG